jgi:hypothetical protein
MMQIFILYSCYPAQKSWQDSCKNLEECWQESCKCKILAKITATTLKIIQESGITLYWTELCTTSLKNLQDLCKILAKDFEKISQESILGKILQNFAIFARSCKTLQFLQDFGTNLGKIFEHGILCSMYRSMFKQVVFRFPLRFNYYTIRYP